MRTARIIANAIRAGHLVFLNRHADLTATPSCSCGWQGPTQRGARAFTDLVIHAAQEVMPLPETATTTFTRPRSTTTETGYLITIPETDTP